MGTDPRQASWCPLCHAQLAHARSTTLSREGLLVRTLRMHTFSGSSRYELVRSLPLRTSAHARCDGLGNEQISFPESCETGAHPASRSSGAASQPRHRHPSWVPHAASWSGPRMNLHYMTPVTLFLSPPAAPAQSCMNGLVCQGVFAINDPRDSLPKHSSCASTMLHEYAS